MKRPSLLAWAQRRPAPAAAGPQPVALVERLWFGKVPSRGDFVRSDGQRAVQQRLDDWMTQAMERWSTDPRWKILYDAAPPLDIAILGTQGQAGLLLNWQASQDASGRRFPFMLCSVLHSPQPATTLEVCGVLMADEWLFLARMAARATRTASQWSLDAATPDDPVQELAPLLHLDAPQQWRVADALSRQSEFLARHTVASLQQMLQAAGHAIDVRQSVLALGVLLQPVVAQGAQRLGRLLRLPLCRDPAMRPEVTAFWMALCSGFLTRGSAELALFLPQGGQEPPELWLGFQGAHAGSLLAVLDPITHADQAVRITQADWVEDSVAADWGLRKLSTYLQDPGLPLQQCLETFQEVFLGV
ncbi:MAG: type secretion system-associated protein TagF [Pseudomonadota bacterium]